MACSRALRSRNHHSAATRLLQIVENSGEELLRCGIRDRRTATSKRTRERIHIARLQSDPMICLESGNRRHRLDDVQPVHGLAFCVAPAIGKGRSHRKESGEANATQEVCIQRQNDIGVIQLVLRIVVLAESCLRSRAGHIPVHRVVLHELCLRILRLHLLPLRRQRRGGDCLRQEVQALPSRKLAYALRECLLEVAPGRGLTTETRTL